MKAGYLLMPYGINRPFVCTLLLLCSLFFLPDLQAQPRVQYYYLYTSEFSPSQVEMDAVTAALYDVQAWFQVATGGLTFVIDNPGAPIVMALQENSMFYYSNFVGLIYEEIYTNGPLDEELDIIKLFFVKGGGGMAAGAGTCGFSGTAWIGMDIFPEFNTGDYFDCPPGTGGAAWPCTPHGAIAHELGHSFSLPHPIDNYPDVAFHSVMQAHWLYPYYYASPAEDPWSLLSVERESLQTCPYLVITDILVPQPYEELPVCNLPANGPTPTADFSYSVNGSQVTFTNESSGAFLYYWTFGNGDVSTEENPQYDFNEDGIYDVRLRASGTNGMMDLAHVQVMLCSGMETSIDISDDEICTGEEVTITATGGSEYLWNTGSTSSTIMADPVQSFQFQVTITASNGCAAVEEVYLYVLESPEVEIFSANINDAICQGESIQLEVDASGNEVLWSTNENEEEITVGPETTSSYSVTVTDPNGCTGTDNITIEVFPVPVAQINTTASQICPGGTITLTASGGTSYAWSNGLTTTQIVVTPDTTTIYTVTAFTGEACEDEATVNIEVWPAASSSIEAPSQVCQGDTVDLTGMGNGAMVWSTGDSTTQIQQVIVNDTSYTLSVMTVNGCTDTSAIAISVFTLSSNIIEASEDSLCIGSLVTLSSPDAAYYLWSTDDTTASIQYLIHDTAAVSLIVTDSNQCIYAFTTDLFVFPSPIIEIQGPTGICRGTSVSLNVADGYNSYLWSTGSDTSQTSANIAGLITIEAIDTFGCTLRDSLNLLADDTEDLLITGPAQICEGDTVMLTATPGLSLYQWSTGQDTNVIFTESEGEYIVFVQGAFGCTNSDTFHVIIDSIPDFGLVVVDNEIIPQGLPAEPLQYLWSNGTTGTSLPVVTSGLYCLTVTNESACSQVQCLEVIISASQRIDQQKFSVYPNPFAHSLNIEGKFQSGDEVLVYDMLGRKCKINMIRTPMGFIISPANSWPDGLYTIQIVREKLVVGAKLVVKG